MGRGGGRVAEETGGGAAYTSDAFERRLKYGDAYSVDIVQITRKRVDCSVLMFHRNDWCSGAPRSRRPFTRPASLSANEPATDVPSVSVACEYRMLSRHTCMFAHPRSTGSFVSQLWMPSSVLSSSPAPSPVASSRYSAGRIFGLAATARHRHEMSRARMAVRSRAAQLPNRDWVWVWGGASRGA